MIHKNRKEKILLTGLTSENKKGMFEAKVVEVMTRNENKLKENVQASIIVEFFMYLLIYFLKFRKNIKIKITIKLIIDVT